MLTCRLSIRPEPTSLLAAALPWDSDMLALVSNNLTAVW